ncbi:MAG: ATP-binding protein [Propionibacteriaceae bacterium]|nr:ATP-binding protein [Propionibacteriaceae bacterium]
MVDTQLERLLRAMGGVVLEGPRGCGKTATGLQRARSSVRLDADPAALALADFDPGSLLDGDTPRLVDEWQLAPSLWNLIRHRIDDRQAKGQFILSGSATPPDDIRRHSGAGRLARLRLRTMTLSELGWSSAQVSFAELPSVTALASVRSPLAYRDLADAAVRGGWPGLLGVATGDALDFNRSYLDDLCSADIPTATGARHDPRRMRRLLASLARNIATEAGVVAVAADVAADGAALDRGTARTYMDALAAVFALEELPAWSVALRSRTRLRSSARLHLADPALACAALEVGPSRLAGDPAYFGQVFEAMAIHDLRVYAGRQRASVYHYRDDTGLEVDVVVEYPDGAWAALEVKLGSAMVEDAERNLLRLRDARVDVDRVGPPAFLAVVTGAESGYTLPSGVHVIPLGALKE